MLLMNRKGQGTLEYLVILAVVLIIAIVVATQVLKLGNIQQVSDYDSKQYWLTASPISIPQYAVLTSGVQIVLQNNSNDSITISDFNLNGVSVGAGTISINPGGKKTVSGTGVKCTTGESYSYKVSLVYSNESLTNIPFPGNNAKPLIGNCAG